MARRPKWVCHTVTELKHPVPNSEMSQRLDEVAEILIECLRQLHKSQCSSQEVSASDPLRALARERTGTDD